MIYLIEDRDYLKIGYTKDIQSRLMTYKTENVYCKLLSYKEGTAKDESILHELCKNYLYTGEWFNNVPAVKKIFEEYISCLDKDYKEFIYILSKRAYIIEDANKKGYNSYELHCSLKSFDVTNSKIKEINNFIRSLYKLDDYKKYSDIITFWSAQKEVVKDEVSYGSYKLSSEITINIVPDARSEAEKALGRLSRKYPDILNEYDYKLILEELQNHYDVEENSKQLVELSQQVNDLVNEQESFHQDLINKIKVLQAENNQLKYPDSKKYFEF